MKFRAASSLAAALGRRSVASFSFALASLAMAGVGCGNDTQAISQGTPAPSSSTAAVNVVVVHGSDTATVDVAALPAQTYKDTSVVPLTTVWAQGKLAGDLTKLSFDFEGDDGFHPSSKDKCKKNLTGEQLGKGYIVPKTRALVWDDALGLPGCYNVHDVAKIIAVDATEGTPAGGG